MGTARKGGIKNIKQGVFWICQMHCLPVGFLPVGFPPVLGMGGFFFQVLFLHIKVMCTGAGVRVAYRRHKGRELEFGCSKWEELGVNLCNKIKKIPVELFSSQGLGQNRVGRDRF